MCARPPCIKSEDGNELVNQIVQVRAPACFCRGQTGSRGQSRAFRPQNTRRYVNLFSRAVDELLPAPSKDISYKSDVHDIIMAHRRERNQINEENEAAGFPPELLRR